MFVLYFIYWFWGRSGKKLCCDFENDCIWKPLQQLVAIDCRQAVDQQRSGGHVEDFVGRYLIPEGC